MTKEYLYFNYTNGPKYEKTRAYFARSFDSHENYIKTLDGRWYNTDLQHRMNIFLRGDLIILDFCKSLTFLKLYKIILENPFWTLHSWQHGDITRAFFELIEGGAVRQGEWRRWSSSMTSLLFNIHSQSWDNTPPQSSTYFPK